jgi:dUTP pyrophosphatase
MLITRPVYFKKLNPNAKTPERAHDSAGYDLFAAEQTCIPPGEVVAVQTGIATDIPRGVVGLIWDRGSMGKAGLKVMGGVVDPDYRGEWMVMLFNTTPSTVMIYPGQKIAQVIFQEFGQFEFREVEHLNDTERGQNGFGSTGA